MNAKIANETSTLDEIFEEYKQNVDESKREVLITKEPQEQNLVSVMLLEVLSTDIDDEGKQNKDCNVFANIKIENKTPISQFIIILATLQAHGLDKILNYVTDEAQTILEVETPSPVISATPSQKLS